jgi:hypothetical protein
MLVVDANVAVAACAEADGFAHLAGEELVAPTLMWSEFFSLTHEGRWRGALSDEHAALLLERLEGRRSGAGNLMARDSPPGGSPISSGWPGPTTPSTSPSPRSSAVVW